ncbi:MAG: nucleoside deaminase [Hydrogenothermaceae bacterium]|nr:nucleoside deaminase [Hydrogenothermaceae bacterium]
MLKDHKKFFDLAYKEAVKAFEKDEVPVGAVIVKDGEVISKAYNQRITRNNAVYHAEILAIEKACKRLNSYRLDGCSIYITLEPCLMCSGAIIQARIKEVYFGSKNEKEGAVITKYTVFDDKKFPHKPKYFYMPDDRFSQLLKEFFKTKRNINRDR